MTNKEALDWLINKISIDVQYSRDIQKDIECLETCKKALEKQTPKKPDAYYDGFYGVYPVWEYKCPCCGMDIEDMDHHCECGQTIDWSDQDETI